MAAHARPTRPRDGTVTRRHPVDRLRAHATVGDLRPPPTSRIPTLLRPVVAAGARAFGADVWGEALDWLERPRARPPDPTRGLPRRRGRASSGRPAAPPRRRRTGVPRPRSCATFRERVAPLTFNAQHPGVLQLLHARRRSRCRSAARCSRSGSSRASTSGTRDPWRRSSRRRSSRWLVDLVGMAGHEPWGVLTSGGVMANLMAPRGRARRPPPALRRDSTPPRGAGARRGPRVRERPDPLLDRAWARRARVPARDAPRGALRRPVPAARAEPVARGRSRRIGRPG